jgi:hypothetical protein
MQKKKKQEKLDDRSSYDIPPLSKNEQFVAFITWGGIPINLSGVRETIMFKENYAKYSTGIWDSLI